MKKILGVFLLALPFIAILIIMVITAGWLNVLIVFGSVFAILASVITGEKLLR